MDDATRALIALSAAIALPDEELLVGALAEAGLRCRAEQVEEALLQSYLFVGYPAALQAIARWRTLSGRPAPAAEATGWIEWERRGAQVCAEVYGGQYERLRENVRALHPDLEHWMVVEGYGKVLGRPGLTLAARELCIVALLVAQRAPQQLYAHLRGALQVGASTKDVERALEVAGSVAGAERAAAAQRVWTQLQARRGAGE